MNTYAELEKSANEGEIRIRKLLSEQIRRHDYSFWFSEDKDVWSKGVAEIEQIKGTIGVLVGLCRIDAQELLDECLAEFAGEGDYKQLARKYITKWFNEYL